MGQAEAEESDYLSLRGQISSCGVLEEREIFAARKDIIMSADSAASDVMVVEETTEIDTDKNESNSIEAKSTSFQGTSKLLNDKIVI